MRLFLFLLVIVAISCSKEPIVDPDSEEMPVNDLSMIEDDFALASSTWYFQVVQATGIVFGQERNERDDDPEGYVTFNEDGTGIYDFQVEIFGQEDAYSKIDIPIEWARLSKDSVLIVEIEQWERDSFYWDLRVANENIIKADWQLFFSEDNFANFDLTLTPEQ